MPKCKKGKAKCIRAKFSTLNHATTYLEPVLYFINKIIKEMEIAKMIKDKLMRPSWKSFMLVKNEDKVIMIMAKILRAVGFIFLFVSLGISISLLG